MKYKVREICQELDIPDSTLRTWLSQGAPYERDSRNHIWITGTEFAAWVEANRKRKASGRKLKDYEAYCLSCRQPVELIDPVTIPNQGKLVHYKGTCPHCSNTIFRGGCQNE
jgi:hypothetical protein